MTNQLRGTFLALLSGALFGMLGYFGTKLVQQQFSIETMLFWRFFMASLWMLIVVFFHDRKRITDSLKNKGLLKIFILATVSYSGSSLFYFLSSGHIGTGPAMVIFYSFPVFVALFAWFAGTWRLNTIAIIALLAVITGLVLLKRPGGYMDWIGIFYGMIAAWSYAMYVYGSQKPLKNLDSSFLTLLVCTGNSLLFLFFSLFTSTFTYPTNLSACVYIVAIGILATALPIQLLLDGLKYISPLKASVISVVEPVITVILGLLFLNESISYAQSAGIFVVLVGALLIQFERGTEGT